MDTGEPASDFDLAIVAWCTLVRINFDVVFIITTEEAADFAIKDIIIRGSASSMSITTKPHYLSDSWTSSSFPVSIDFWFLRLSLRWRISSTFCAIQTSLGFGLAELCRVYQYYQQYQHQDLHNLHPLATFCRLLFKFDHPRRHRCWTSDLHSAGRSSSASPCFAAGHLGLPETAPSSFSGHSKRICSKRIGTLCFWFYLSWFGCYLEGLGSWAGRDHLCWFENSGCSSADSGQTSCPRVASHLCCWNCYLRK